jgi:ComF family protein
MNLEKLMQPFHKFILFSHWLLPQSCFLCGDISRQPICLACLNDLPYQGPACIRCAKALKEVGICQQCRDKSPPYHQTQVVFDYVYPIDKLISSAKFHHNLAILNLLGHLMAQHLIIEQYPDVLIPVPLHIKRLRKRGYNQSLELAKCIAKQTGILLDSKACKRIKHTRPQTTLSKQQRQTNVEGVFKVVRLQEHWQHIVLVDDVMTTGATVRELALAFKKAGISRVDVWCCARRQR